MPIPADIISANERQLFPQHYLLNQFDSANCCILSRGTLADFEIGELTRQCSLSQLALFNNLNSKPPTPVFSSLDATRTANLRHFKKKKISLSYFVACIWILIRMVFLGKFSVCLVERGRKLVEISINQFFSEKLK